MRSFAIIPAAGHSRRMGRHKLMLPFGESTVLQQVLQSWQASCVDEVVVVARRGDDDVLLTCRQSGVHTVTPRDDPAEMKVSIQHGLGYVRENFSPSRQDVWLLAPADSPRLSSAIIELLLSVYEPANRSIVVPTCAGRRGHPVLFPWILASEVSNLGVDQGVNALLDRHLVSEIACPEPSILDDLDTPEDYRRLRTT